MMIMRRQLTTFLCILGGMVLFAPSAALAESAPTPTSLPVVTGDVIVGHTLTASNGTWSSEGVLSYYYQWQRCNPLNFECSVIAGATTSSYTPTAADLGETLEIWVTADVEGEGPGLDAATGINSVATTPVVLSASDAPPHMPGVAPHTRATAEITQPTITSPPVIKGHAIAGQTLVATVPTVTGGPGFTISYLWERSTRHGYEGISGATSPTYLVRSGDVKARLRVLVFATNEAGQAYVFSASTAPARARGKHHSPRHHHLPRH